MTRKMIMLFCGLMIAGQALAQTIYKCPQSDGKIKYQSLPCPAGNTVSVVDSGKATGTPVTETTATGLRLGEQAILDQARQREEAQRQAAAEARREESARLQRMAEKQIMDFQRDVYCEFSPIPCHERRK